MTVADAVTRCLKKGKGDEQALAARCITMLCIQLGTEAEELMADVIPVLIAVLTDSHAALKARGEVRNRMSHEMGLTESGKSSTGMVKVLEVFKEENVFASLVKA